MKKNYTLLLALFTISCLSLLFTQCLKQTENGNTVFAPPSVSFGSSHVHGLVVNKNGEPLGGVTITAFTKTATTNSYGLFTLEDAPLINNRLQITAQKEGFFKKIHAQKMQAEHTTLKLEMIAQSSATIDANTGGIVDMETASVDLPTNAYVNQESGETYTGSVTVAYHHYNPSDPHFPTDMPGADFRGITTDGDEMLLISYGAVAVELTDDTGNELQLAEGETATLRLTVPSELLDDAPSTIPLWHFNEETAKWEEEGMATLDGDEYVGEVSHFSTWNCDDPVSDRAEVYGFVKDCNGAPLANVPVQVGPLMVYTDEEGTYQSNVAEELSFSVSVQESYFEYPSNEIDITGVSADEALILEDLILPCLTNITGTIESCTGNNSPALLLFSWEAGNSIIHLESNQFFLISPLSAIGTTTTLSVFTPGPLVGTTQITIAEGENPLTTPLEVCEAVDGECPPELFSPSLTENQNVCSGFPVTVSATGGDEYLWNTTETSASIEVTLTTPTTYYVTISNSFGCMAIDSITLTPISSENLADAGPDQTYCGGNTIVLNATGGDTFEWSNGSTNQNLYLTPSTTTTYTVTVSGYGCTATDEVTIFVEAPIDVNLGENQLICPNQTTTLTATSETNGLSYLWSTGHTTTSINVSPSSSTNYAVTATADNGCTTTDWVWVQTYTEITEETLGVCSGESINLNAVGTNWLWSTGETSQTINVSPAVNTTYTVSFTSDDGCELEKLIQVEVISDSTEDAVAEAGPNQTICVGGSTILSVSGGTYYEWNTGQNTPTIIVEPTSTNTYTVTVTACNGTTAIDEITVNVGNAVASASPNQTICYGSSATITGSGGSAVSWGPSVDGASITVNPGATTTYTVTVSDANGCTDTAETTVNVEDLVADAGPDQTICLGESTTLTATGGSFVQWNTGGDGVSITVTPEITTSYPVTVSSANGCTDTDEVTVIVEDCGG